MELLPELREEGERMTDNCPNCGAPKRGTVCAYCGTHFACCQGKDTVEVGSDIVTIRSWEGDEYQIVRGYNIDVKVVGA